MHIAFDQIAQIGEIVGTVIAIDGIIKQVALKQGNTKLVSICDLVANDLNELLVVSQAILSIFKPKSGNSAQATPIVEVKP